MEEVKEYCDSSPKRTPSESPREESPGEKLTDRERAIRQQTKNKAQTIKKQCDSVFVREMFKGPKQYYRFGTILLVAGSLLAAVATILILASMNIFIAQQAAELIAKYSVSNPYLLAAGCSFATAAAACFIGGISKFINGVSTKQKADQLLKDTVEDPERWKKESLGT